MWEQVNIGADVEIGDAVADVQLREVLWANAQLVGRRFTGLVCSDVRFVRGDLAGAVFEDCRFTRVVFKSCRMNGAIFAGATMQDVQWVDCVAELADFRLGHVRRSAAERTNLREADFYGCSLTEVRLVNCELSGSNFERAHAQGLDLRGSTVANLRGVDALAGARISSDQMMPLGVALIDSLGFRVD